MEGWLSGPVGGPAGLGGRGVCRRVLLCAGLAVAVAFPGLAWAASEAGAQSPFAYGDLSTPRARDLLEAKFGGWLTQPAPLITRPGLRVERFIGDHLARVDVGPRGLPAVVASPLPLRARDASGALHPVDLSLERSGASFVPSNPLVDVRLGDRSGEGVSLPGGVRMRPVGGADVPGVASDGRVVYASTQADTDFVLRPDPTGAEALWDLRSPAAPERLAVALDLPKGAELVATQAPVPGFAVRQDGRTLGLIPQPTAFDATGKTVALQADAQGSSLVLNVAHRSSSVTYPVLVDPNYVPVTFNGADLASQGAGGSGWWVSQGCSGCFTYGQTWPEPGLYISAWGYRFNGDWGHWIYPPPSGAFLFGARYTWRHHAQNDTARIGISGPGQAETLNTSATPDQASVDCYPRPGTINPSLEPPCPYPNNATDRTNARNAIFVEGMTINGDGQRDGPTVFMSNIVLYLGDDIFPAIASATPQGPTGWTNGAGTGQVILHATDQGLGVHNLGARYGGNWLGTPTVYDGSQCRSAFSTDPQCNRDVTSTITYPLAALPEGVDTVLGGAQDQTDNIGQGAGWQVKVDRSAPTVTESGDAWKPPGNVLAPGDHAVSVTASDPYSGVASIEIDVDGQPKKTYTAQSCSQAGCPSTGGTTYQFNTDEYTFGSHRIDVISRDQAGNTKTPPDSETVTFGTAAGGIGETCDSGQAISSGYVADTYLGLKFKQTTPTSALVCFQIADALGLTNHSTVVGIKGLSANVQPPVVDGNGSACPNVLVSDTSALGTVVLSDFIAPGELWVCLQGGGLSERSVFNVPSASVPQVVVRNDTPPPVPPMPVPPPAGLPSSQCQQTTDSALVDNNIVGTQFWLSYYSPARDTLAFCVREQGSNGGAGGVLTVNADGGVQPQVGSSPDTSPCSVVINHADAPVRLHLDASPPGNPQSICVDTGTFIQRYYAGATPSGAPVTYTPDP
jgi:hypothetical protein